MTEHTAVVIGAGQAGLAASYHLQQRRIDHVVLERGRIGETWRSQRWDSFAVNTPNWSNGLPGAPYDGPDPDGFYLRDELVGSFERYAQRFDLPVRAGVEVTAVDRAGDAGYAITTGDGDYVGRHVIVAAGIMNVPRTPALSGALPGSIAQFHTATYRHPGQLPVGAVLVVGGGQSGAQIVEELLDAGRTVYFATSRTGYLARRYRGRDSLAWWRDMGFLDVTLEALEDPAMQYATQPLISGTRGGHTVTLPGLARAGARLLGRLQAVDGHVLTFDRHLGEHIEFGSEYAERMKRAIDDYIAANDVEAPPPEREAVEAPLDDIEQTATLDLEAADVTTVIWTTGFEVDFSWLHVPVLDDAGIPVHERGVCADERVYFIGFPWLHSRKSGIIWGVDEDAAHIADRVVQREAGGSS